MEEKIIHDNQCDKCKNLNKSVFLAMPNPKDTLYTMWCEFNITNSLKECEHFEYKEE